MKILAIDTSNRPLSVAVLDDEDLLATTTTNRSHNHSTTLMPIIEDLLKMCNLKPDEIDRYVVANGPGSYTGLRIGVTTAKVLSSTLDKQLVGVSSLEVLARALPSDQKALIVPLFDARNNNVFAGAYQYQNGILKAIIPDQHVNFDKLAVKLKGSNVIFVGKDARNFEKRACELLNEGEYAFADKAYDYPQAYILGLIGLHRKPGDIDTFIPNYHRLTQAEVQWLEKNPNGKVEDTSYVEQV